MLLSRRQHRRAAPVQCVSATQHFSVYPHGILWAWICSS